MFTYAPSLFHYRCRELLRRIKQREFEYTSSRTKARNWLGSSKDQVRQLLDDCVTGQGYSTHHIGAWLALARAAPEGSEARQTAQLDAQICYLLQQAEDGAAAASAAWQVVETIRGGGGGDDDDSKKKETTTTQAGAAVAMELEGVTNKE